MLTVLLATRNRAEILRGVLEAYTQLQALPSGWKLVVVDNGSTDQTASVVASFADRLPVRYVFEGKLGKNHALNTGLALAEGDLTVFTDDDAFPHADWLMQLRHAADTQPASSMFGGAVVPRWEVPPPRWVEWTDQGAVYTLTDPTLTEGPIEPGRVFGPNMALRSSVFTDGVRFDTAIGPRGSNYAMGGETELVLRLSKLGHKAWHVPGAVVEHFIREEQLRTSWVLQRAFRFGRGQYRIRANDVGVRMACMGTPLYLLRRMFRQMGIMAVTSVSLDSEMWLRSRWRFNYLRGMAAEARSLAREKPAPAQSNRAAIHPTRGSRRPE